MSGYFDEQIRTRIQSDIDAFNNAFSEISEAITGQKIFSGEENNSLDAIGEIARYYNLPDNITINPENDINMEPQKIFNSLGIMHRSVKLTHDWYNDASGVYLAKLKNGRYIALLNDYKGYYYNDHETNKRIRINSRTQENIDTEAVCFYKSLPDKKLLVKDLIIFAVKNLAISDITSIIIITLSAVLISMTTPYLLQLVYSQVIYSNSIQSVSSIFIFIICAGISSNLFNIAKNLALSRINIKTDTCINAAIIMRVINLPAEFFKDYSSGELAKRTQAAGQLCKTLADVIFSLGLTALISLIYLAQIFAFTPLLVLPALLIMSLLLILSVVITIWHSIILRRSTEIDAKEYGLIYALITGMQKIKLTGSERRAFSKWAKLYSSSAKLTYNPPLILKLTQAIQPAVILIGTLIIYYFALKSSVAPENYMAFTASYGLLSGAFISLSGAALSIANIQPLIDLIRPILNAIPEISRGKSLTHITGNIEISSIKFRYTQKTPLILDNFSLKIKRGEYLAIVGKSGAGKSTLIRLLLGFEHPESGVIYYDNHDLKTLDIKSLRKNIGCVMQNSKLFPGSIFSNIIISAPNLTEQDAWEAAKMAGIAEDIEKMPMQMNTVISEGANTLSGGQRQRIIIARAIAPRPKILLFDEATSALDNLTQKNVSNSLEKLNCTRIIIAHRLSTVKNCDRIIVLDEGRISEMGKYDDLMNKHGLFYELVQRQI